jgi:hypothetical protein
LNKKLNKQNIFIYLNICILFFIFKDANMVCHGLELADRVSQATQPRDNAHQQYDQLCADPHKPLNSCKMDQHGLKQAITPQAPYSEPPIKHHKSSSTASTPSPSTLESHRHYSHEEESSDCSRIK